jgi:hypothetical protein
MSNAKRTNGGLVFCDLNFGFHLAGKRPDKPGLLGGFEGRNTREISLPGSAALWAESFNFVLWHLIFS